MKVLFVEDEFGTVSGTASWLTRHGHEVSYVGSILDAELLIETERFDLILFDVRIPITREQGDDEDAEQSGVELARRLKRGDLGTENKDSVFAFYTNQTRSVRDQEFKSMPNYMGNIGKNAYLTFVRRFEREFA